MAKNKHWLNDDGDSVEATWTLVSPTYDKFDDTRRLFTLRLSVWIINLFRRTMIHVACPRDSAYAATPTSGDRVR